MENTQTEKKVKKKYSITVKPNKEGKHYNILLNVVRVLFFPAFCLVKPFRFFGSKKLPDGACIFICNHYAMLDPAYPAALTWEQIHFVAKKELFKNSILRCILRAVKAIGVNRDGNDARSLLDCFKCLKNGEKLCIFPEGTRNKGDADMLPFHSGAAVMAIKCKTPIIPMVIYKKPKFFRCAHILIGEPIELSSYYDRKLTDEEIKEADEFLRQKMLQMKAEHTAYLQDKKAKRA